MAYDNFFKQLMQDFLKGCEVRSDEPVGTLPLKIDLVIKCPQKDSNSVSIPILETHFSSINLIEYKSSHDTPKNHDLSKLLGYLGLYCDRHAIGIDEIHSKFSLWYISANRPPYIDNLLKNDTIIELEIKGLYKVKLAYPCPYFLMIINELDINELNLPLLLLSSGETLKNTIRLLVRATIFPESKLKKYLRLIYIINYKEVHQMSEMQSFLPESVKENIRLAIEDVGLKEVIESIGVEKVIKAVGLEEVIKAVSLEEVIKAVGIKKVESILQKLKKNK